MWHTSIRLICFHFTFLSKYKVHLEFFICNVFFVWNVSFVRQVSVINNIIGYNNKISLIYPDFIFTFPKVHRRSSKHNISVSIILVFGPIYSYSFFYFYPVFLTFSNSRVQYHTLRLKTLSWPLISR